MFKKYSNKLFCFSPPVMIATFIIEIVLAAYVLWRYKLNEITRLVMLILVFLAIFQLAEFMICGGMGMDGIAWARVGYVAITLLPPLGIQLAYTVAKKKPDAIVWFSWASAVAFIFFFSFATQSITGHVCQGNYVIFDVAPGSVWAYALYYYGLLLTGIWLCLKWVNEVSKKQAKALRALAIGYGTFILPTTAANLVAPETIDGIPSIMCGFAVLLAFVLVFWMLPAIAKRIR